MARVAERKREEKKEKVISFNEFKKLVDSDGWERSQRIETADRFIVKRWRPKLSSFEYVIRRTGVATKFNKLGNIEIIYTEMWECDKDDPDSLTIINIPGSWAVEGVTVIYDNDEVVTTYALTRALPNEFSAIDYTELSFN